jgi:UDP-glucose 4-epimerase
LVEFLQKNNQILVYDNLSSSLEADVVPLVDKGAKFLQGDVLDVDTLREFSKDVDVIISSC